MYTHAVNSAGFERDERTKEEISQSIIEAEKEEVNGLIKRYTPDYEVCRVTLMKSLETIIDYLVPCTVPPCTSDAHSSIASAQGCG